ncbi:11763_t:CDS:2 [Gigaspora margarita]|uniref:11763_t:CDS:1 n=1 Tax=Gigaspora margarita TaxID=4874 RepID=A0ABM8VZB2_GIGMA|nr:11763_t:CDS:2 [Gigaspora margarita]
MNKELDIIYNKYKHAKLDFQKNNHNEKQYYNRLHYLSGVGCKQNIEYGYRLISEASDYGLPDAKLWMKKYKSKNDYGTKEAKKLFGATMENISYGNLKLAKNLVNLLQNLRGDSDITKENQAKDKAINELFYKHIFND